MRKLLRYLFVGYLVAGSVSGCAARPIVENLELSDVQDTRHPASIRSCELLFASASQQATPSANRPSRPSRPSHTFESLRLGRLARGNFTLEQILDVIAPVPHLASADQISLFIRSFIPSMTADQIGLALRSRSGVRSRMSSLLSRNKNAKDLTAQEVIEKTNAPDASRGFTDILLIEAYLRMGTQRPSQAQLNQLISRVQLVGTSNLLIDFISANYPDGSGTATRIQLVNDVATLSGESVTGESLGRILGQSVTTSGTEFALRDLLIDLPGAVETRSFITAVTASDGRNTPKIKAWRVLELAHQLGVPRSSPSTWQAALELTMNTTVADRRDVIRAIDRIAVEDLEKSRDAPFVTTLLRASQNIRVLEARGNPTVSVVGAYTQLLNSVAQAERPAVLRSILELGTAQTRIYLGNDSLSANRITELLELSRLPVELNLTLEEAVTGYTSERLQSGHFGSSETSLLSRIERRYPTDRAQGPNLVADLLRASELTNADSIREYVTRRQGEVEISLQRALASVLQANAPPGVFQGSWNAYLKSLPTQVRSEHLAQLLAQNYRPPNLDQLARFIQSLEPIEGVRETVINFLRRTNAMNSNRSDYTQEQVLRMFGGDRFERFFPHLSGVRLQNGIRTKFIIAIATDPSQTGARLGPIWLREKLNDNQVQADVAQVFGFRPALQYTRLAAQLDANFQGAIYGVSPSRQIRGLIVQGHYEKSGRSIMVALGGERGQAQVESVAPTIARRLELQLASQQLSTQPVFIQRLFTTYWNLNSDASLINNIRNRAILIAEQDSSFWNLRVEIHNFPSHDTLRRVRAYRSTKTSRTEEVDTIIRELESFLGVSTNGSMSDLIQNRLSLKPSSAPEIANLARRGGEFESQSPNSQLATLVAIRDRLESLEMTEFVSNTPRQKKHLAAQALSELSTVVFSRWLDGIDSLSHRERIEGVTLGIEHLKRDGIFTASQTTEFVRILESISRSNMNDLQKKENINQVLRGLIDQVYFKIQDEFGYYDNSLARTALGNVETPILRFVDNFMRSGMTFIISKFVDLQAREIALTRNIAHSIGGREARAVVEVYNPGEAVGVLRVNRNPMELSTEDIAVFEQMPGESAAVAGFITVGVGARLSHLQLLSKSLKIPNVQLSNSLLADLKQLDGKWVRFTATENGRLVIEEASRENRSTNTRERIRIPVANHSIKEPIDFSNLVDNPQAQFAGPKGVTLAKMFRSPDLRPHVPDGVVLPFGFFAEYAQRTGLKPLLDLLAQVKLENRYLVGIITAQISLKIRNNPIPPDMLSKLKNAVDGLGARTGNQLGYFIRSDTNVEDLPNFNGAGLNESVANVANDSGQLDSAVRRVWISPYTEKSIYWRGQALGNENVTLAEPSVVIMPTIQAQSSGVLISRGGPDWQPGRGLLSANFGIGSVVEAGRPVEEFTFEQGTPVRLVMSVSRTMPFANAQGGLQNRNVEPGTPVLSTDQATALNSLGQRIERRLGPQSHGWDIEWAIDASNRLVILQARPNM